MHTVLSACLAAMVMAFILPMTANAQSRVYCPLPEHGTWVNEKAAPKDITRLEIVTRCINDGVEVRVRAYTSCIPRDCKWGWTDGQARPGGGVRVVLVGFFGSKRIDLRAIGDRMDAYVINAMHDPTQQETVKSYVLRRQ